MFLQQVRGAPSRCWRFTYPLDDALWQGIAVGANKLDKLLDRLSSLFAVSLTAEGLKKELQMELRNTSDRFNPSHVSSWADLLLPPPETLPVQLRGRTLVDIWTETP